MRVMEDGARRGGELGIARLFQALIDLGADILGFALARDLGYFLRSADRAAHAIGPAHCFEVCQALLIGRKGPGNVYQLHGANIRLTFACVKCIIIKKKLV